MCIGRVCQALIQPQDRQAGVPSQTDRPAPGPNRGEPGGDCAGSTYPRRTYRHNRGNSRAEFTSGEWRRGRSSESGDATPAAPHINGESNAVSLFPGRSGAGVRRSCPRAGMGSGSAVAVRRHHAALQDVLQRRERAPEPSACALTCDDEPDLTRDRAPVLCRAAGAGDRGRGRRPGPLRQEAPRGRPPAGGAITPPGRESLTLLPN